MGSWLRRGILLAVAVLVIVAPKIAHAQGGPPLQTDDTGTPGPRNWEINIGLTTERRATEREFEAPILDLNYGVGERLQLKFEVPWVLHASDTEPTKDGLGNSRVGVRWRFFENKRLDFAFSTYPQLDFNNPNNSVDRGLAERGVKFLLPIEATKRVGPVYANAEAGYRFSQYGPDEWLAGLALGRQVTKRLELLGEFYTDGPRGGERDQTLDGGGRYRIHGPMVLLFMVGRGIGSTQNEPDLVGYLGVQFQLEHHHQTSDENRSSR